MTHPVLNCVALQMAYLATSLLVDPSSELSILVTATIQADLKSDNFLVGELPLRLRGHTFALRVSPRLLYEQVPAQYWVCIVRGAAGSRQQSCQWTCQVCFLQSHAC